jgi:hypothetical protein
VVLSAVVDGQEVIRRRSLVAVPEGGEIYFLTMVSFVLFLLLAVLLDPSLKAMALAPKQGVK